MSLSDPLLKENHQKFVINKGSTICIIKEEIILEDNINRYHGRIDAKEAGVCGVDIIGSYCIITHSDILKSQI